MSELHRGIDPELEQILKAIVRPSERFGHRHHVHLAFLAVHRYGMPAAVERMSRWLQEIADHGRVSNKYHHTLTRAWVELVAHHVAADPRGTEFERFARHNSALFDKDLLSTHYRASTLVTDRARRGWVEPDLVPLPPSS